ncbi:MAG: response regulator transcription factor [Thiotrichales bacterium]|nr:response regulator transcription factor [Thiotrichales bacterium]
MHILLVEDDTKIMATLVDYLELDGFTFDCAYHGQAAIELCRQHHFDVIVMDIMMPRLDGIQAAKVLRETLKLDTPILFLTAKDSIEDKTLAFQAGGDDYLVKPFSLDELRLRLLALNKRRRSPEQSALQVGPLCFNLQTEQLFFHQKSIKLAPKQLAIVRFLLEQHPQLISRARLEQHLWGEDVPNSDALRSHLYSIRQALSDEQGPFLQTLPTKGYRLRDPNA